MAPLLQMQGIGLTLGGTPLLAGADLAVERGDRLCLVGRNGSGKSTLLKIAAGALEADRGTVFRQPDATIRYLPQEPDLSGFSRVEDYVLAGLGPADDHHRARRLLEGLGLSADADPRTLSGGEARRAALARTLAPEPDILLLDEPTNHLDLPAIEWLENELAGLRSAIVLVSHDRRFLTNLSRATVWLDRGETRRLDRGFGAFEAWRDKLLDEEEVAAQKLDRKIVAEEHWMRYGVTARRKRNMRRVGELAELRRTKREAQRAGGGVKLAASDAGLSGRLVIEAEGVAKRFGDTVVVGDLSLRVMRGDRLALVGANGAGKTTLVNLLTGALAPDGGRVRIGSNVAMASLDQRRAALDPAATLSDALTGGGSEYVEVAGARKHVVGYMRDFLFKPEQARTPVGRLSGGERARLMLARALAQPANLLVLDEPTNDLDLETLDLVEDLLADHPGTVIVVSHDRDFLDRVATSVLMAEGSGRWTEYAGGYSDMVLQRGAGVSASPVVTTQKSARAESAAPRIKAASRKLGFKEKHALDTLPGEMEALRSRREGLRAVLDDATLYARDPKRFGDASRALADTDAALAAAEDRWLELELLREEVEGRCMTRMAFVNGAFVPFTEAAVPITDRGFLFGDGIYEVTAVLDGRLVDAHAHLARLGRCLAEVRIANPFPPDRWIALQDELVRRDGVREGVVYLQVTRGAAERDFAAPKDVAPSVVMFTQAKAIVDAPLARTGAAVVSVPDLRWARRDIKSVALLAQVLAKQAAVDAGAQEAWMVEDGLVTEGSSSTAWIVTGDGSVVTRPLSTRVLPGVTRRALLALLGETGGRLDERPFSIAEAQGAAEAFFTSASAFVMPVVSIDGEPVGGGVPGPHARRLRELYLAFARA